MKIVQINHFSYKAAGAIMMNLHRAMTQKGIESYIVWGRGRDSENDHEYYMSDELGVNFHALYTRVTDRTGFASVRSTKQLINWLEQIHPDIIHLHCVHGYYINIEILFDYIRAKHIKVVWTQHDCWSFTGHCAYFDAIGCEKWKTGCYKCPQLMTYPKAYLDASKNNWSDKKRLFTGMDVVCVTPCEWLKGLLTQSFLSDYPCHVIYNGIDTNVFHYTESNFKNRAGLEGYRLILGVASEWTERKGLKDFVCLNSKIDHSRYKIILIGLTKEQLKTLPETIFAMERTNNINELVEIYSAADIYFNPTYEDNFPTTNIEAIACGTKVITYKTGGAPEAIRPDCGYVVEKGDLDGSYRLMQEICASSEEHSNRVYKEDWMFSSKRMVNEYLSLYETIG